MRNILNLKCHCHKFHRVDVGLFVLTRITGLILISNVELCKSHLWNFEYQSNDHCSDGILTISGRSKCRGVDLIDLLVELLLEPLEEILGGHVDLEFWSAYFRSLIF